MVPPDSPTNWRFVAGTSVLILSCALPFSAFLVPLLDLSVAQSAMIGGVLVAGAPEVLVLLAIALLGRKNFDLTVGTAKKFFFTTFFSSPVSRERYYAGLAVFLLTFIPFYIAGYAPTWMPPGNGRIFVLAASDLAFIVSVFVMGGEFWEKFQRLFIWEGKV